MIDPDAWMLWEIEARILNLAQIQRARSGTLPGYLSGEMKQLIAAYNRKRPMPPECFRLV